jgi:hypothetical protein
VPLGTVPGGQAVVAELGADPAVDDPAAVGALFGVAFVDEGVDSADELAVVEFGFPELVVGGPAFALDPFCVAAAGAGTHVIPPAGVACVPCGPGLAVVGVVCAFVPGVGVCGVVCAPGPAAFVVIDVGGPIGVAGEAGAPVGAAAAGVEVCGAGVAAGGGAVARL